MSAWIIDVLWKVSLQAGILALVVLGVSRLTEKAPARLRHALWVLVLVKFIVPPLAYFPQQIAFWQGKQEVRAVVSLPATASNAMSTDTAAADDAPVYVEPSSAYVPPLARLDWRLAVVIAWMAGAGAMCLQLAGRFRQQRRLLSGCLAADQGLMVLLADAARELGISRLPKLRISEAAPTAMLLGLLRPSILLPAAMVTSCSRTDIRAILLHELAHFKRVDLLVTWLHQMAQVIFFFHPALWLVGRKIRREGELACDEHVLTTSCIPADEYASGYMAALKLAVRIPVPSSVAMAEPLDFENRRLISMMSPISMFGRRWVVLLLLMAVVGLPTFAGVRYMGRASADHPTVEYLAAALREQEAKLPQSIDVHYTDVFTRFEDGRVIDAADRDYHYTRTLDVQRLEKFRKYGESDSMLTIDIDSYNIAKNESRTWSVDVKPRSGLGLGHISKGIPGQLSVREMFETVRYPLYEGSLIDRIPHGIVSPTMDAVDGHNCWRVDIPADYPHLEKYTVWLDPSIGYSPRRIMFVWNDGRAPHVVTYENYRDYAGFWFPDKQIVTYDYGPEDRSRTFSCVNTITQIRTGNPMTTEELMRFPSGMRVVVPDGQDYYAP